MDIAFSQYVKDNLKKSFLFLTCCCFVAVVMAFGAISWAHNNKQSDLYLFCTFFGTIILLVGFPSFFWYFRSLLLLGSKKERFFVTVNSKGIMFRMQPYSDRVYIPWVDVEKIYTEYDEQIAFEPSGIKTGQVKEEVFEKFYKGEVFYLPNQSDKTDKELVEIFNRFKLTGK